MTRTTVENKSIYLTIDDSPSKFMREKVDFLKRHRIPAVFFCRGEFIPTHVEHVVYAIQKGFLIGNHSYTHPFFSKISLDQSFEEILSTEKLIGECYQKAKVRRPSKVVRFPFGDKGLQPDELQAFLTKQGFVPLQLGQYDDGFIDAGRTWNTQDYEKRFIEDVAAYEKNLEKHWANSGLDEEVILVHDFDNNPHLFAVTMRFLMSKQVKFMPFGIK